MQVDGTTSGDVTESHVVWERAKGNPRFAKPLYRNGLIFQITDIGVASCIDAASGEELWKDRVPGDYRSSPILAGDHLYFFSEGGRGTVLQAGRTIDEVAVNEVPGMGTTACPAVSDGAIFVRGRNHLYKIQQ